MIAKKWLEDIKERFVKYQADYNLNGEDVEWLIQQAEKREYWMKQHRKRANELEDAYFKIQLIEKQLHQAQAKAERYKQALEFYADEENYEPLEVQIGAVTKEGYKISKYKYEPIINTDKGKKARQELKGE